MLSGAKRCLTADKDGGPEHPPMTHRVVLADICFSLGAIQAHMPQVDHAGLLAQPKDLNKQSFQLIEVAATEFTVTAVVRLLITGQYAKAQILVAGPLNLAGGYVGLGLLYVPFSLADQLQPLRSAKF